MRTLIALAVMALLFCSPVNAEPSPTATEVFHLRSECSNLGKQLLEENRVPSEHGFSNYFSKYDEETNRCYVMIKDTFLKEHAAHLTLWDGQGGGVIAQWSSNDPGGLCFIKGQTVSPAEAFAYIQNMMKDNSDGK